MRNRGGVRGGEMRMSKGREVGKGGGFLRKP